MNSNQEFRDKLMQQDDFGKTNNADYCRGLEMLLNRPLGLVNRIFYGVICVAGLAAIIYFLDIIFLEHIGDVVIAPAIRLICFIAIIMTSVFTVFAGWSAITGKSKGHFQPALVFGGSCLMLYFYFTTVLYFVFVAPVTLENPLNPHSMAATQIMIILFFAMVLIGLILILRAVVRAEFAHQRKLLEIEYKLCTVLEQLEKLQKKRD